MEKNRYSAEELEEFRQIISGKLARAQAEYESLQKMLAEGKTTSSKGGVITMDNSAEVAERETLNDLAVRQLKFIKNLERAHARIEKGTYGICCVTGRLIDKERLRIVPHTTHSVEAKKNRL